MAMQEFLELNRKHLFNRLDNIGCNKQIYIVNDLIDVLSNTPSRDRSRINKYSVDYVYIGYAMHKNRLMLVRLFTEAGIEYYLNDGNITNYNDACSYFGISPIDLEHKKYMEQFSRIKNKCIDGKFKSSIILTWLYDKQKNISRLPVYISNTELIDFINSYNTADLLNKKKYNIFLKHKFEPCTE